MSNIFATDQIILSGQLLSTTGTQLYLDGLLIGSGTFAALGTSFTTGLKLYQILTGMSGSYKIPILLTGQQSWSGANSNSINLSGNLTSTGRTIYPIVTGTSGVVGNLSLLTTGVSGYLQGTRVVSKFVWIDPTAISIGVQTSSIQNFFGLTGQVNNQLGNQFASPYVTFLDLTTYTGVRLIGMVNGNTNPTGSLYLGYLNTGNLSSEYLNYPISPSTFSYLDSDNTNSRWGTNIVVMDSGFHPIVPAARSGVYVALLWASGKPGEIAIFDSCYMELI